MHRLPIVVLAVISCRSQQGYPQPSDTLAQHVGRSAAVDSGAGLYVGRWNDNYGGRWWLALFLGPNGRSGVVYDPPQLIQFCLFNTDTGGQVLLDAEGLSLGMPYTAVIKGTRVPSGIHGDLAIKRGYWEAVTAQIDLAWHPLVMDTGSGQRPSDGVYARVQVHKGTGDLLGDEVLLITTANGLLALYTNYAGGPDGPYLADTVTLTGDTATISVTSGRLDREYSLRHLFVLAPAAGRIANEPAVPDLVVHLESVRTIRQIIDAARSTKCPTSPLPPRPSVQPT